MKKGIWINDQWYDRKKILHTDSKPDLLDADIFSFLKEWYNPENHVEALTSGSTGTPKTIHLQKSYAAASARATLEFFSISPGSTALLSLPVRYIAGRMMLIRALEGNLRLYTTPPASHPQIPDQNLDFAAFTPHQFYHISSSSDRMKHLNIKTIILGGSPVTPDIVKKSIGFGGKIYETFGMTETYSHIALRSVYPETSDWFCAVPGVHFRSEEGHLIIEAPHLGIRDLKTNDQVKLKSNTEFQWLGRSDFVINSGGIKIFPEVIEKKLASAISSPFFIAGIPHPSLGEQVALVIEKSETKSAVNRENIFNRNLSQYEKPRTTIYVHRIVKTATGKINRTATLQKDNIFHESK